MARPSRTGGKTSEAKARNASPAKGRKTTKTKPRIAPAATRVKRRSVSDPSKDLKEAREQQAATAEILKVIASSPDDVQPVFEAIASSANRLIGGFSTAVYRFINGIAHLAAFTPTSPAADEVLKSLYPRPTSDFPQFELARTSGKTWQIRDVEEAPEPEIRKVAQARGWRSSLGAPLMSDGATIGLITVTRSQTGSFSNHHVQLLQTFADQAVIAIENIRLFNETREALERQTATADILKVIASSPSDVQPVFDAIAHSAKRLIGGFSTAVHRVIDDTDHLVAFTPTNPESDEVLKAAFPRHRSEMPAIFSLVENGETAQIVNSETANGQIRKLARARGWRSATYTPLMNQGAFIGFIVCTRRETGMLAGHHVQLLRTFADQAVIAIENVRLFNETREALEHQTATAEVLRVISSSMADPKPVSEHIVDSVERLFKCKQIGIFLTPGDGFLHFAAGRGSNMEFLSEVYPRPVEETAAPLVLGARQQVYYEDCLNGTTVPLSLRRAAQVIGNFSDVLTPMLWEDRGVGMMTITREPNAGFSDKERALLRTFSDQAVIAIENARLFNETKEHWNSRPRSEVLEVVSASPGEMEPVFQKMLENATRVCGANFGAIELVWRAAYQNVAHYNIPTHTPNGRSRPFIRTRRADLATVARPFRRSRSKISDTAALFGGRPTVVTFADLAGARTDRHRPDAPGK